MRWAIAFLVAMAIGSGPVAAQPADAPAARQCLLIPQAAVKILQRLEQGACQSGCRGCGCKGGPGYRDAAGDCVGYANIHAKCGPPPHAGCAAECVPTVATCRVFGRAFLADLAKDEGLLLKWREADPDTLARYPDAKGAAVERRMATDEAALRPADGKTFQCGAKRTCTEMTSCEEARFHYSQCGLTRLDGTGNGVPCKALCAR